MDTKLLGKRMFVIKLSSKMRFPRFFPSNSFINESIRWTLLFELLNSLYTKQLFQKSFKPLVDIHSTIRSPCDPVDLVTIGFRPLTGKLEDRIFADGTITTGGNNSVETTWQRERKLVTISWYTEICFERAYTDVKDKTIFGSTVLLF